MKSVASSKRIWRIITSDRSLDTKYTAGATDIISRKNVWVETGAPPHIEVNVPVWKMAWQINHCIFSPTGCLSIRAGG